ncbi:cellulose biosynthesis protein BcsS [Methylobacterium iners]
MALLLSSTATCLSSENPVSALIFGSLDASPAVFATAGVKLAPGGVDREGFAILASGGAGARSERGPVAANGVPTTAMRITGLGAALVGYQWFHD